MLYQKLRKKENTYFKMGLFIRVNGKVMKGMDMEFNNGLMVLNMKDFGKITKLMEKGPSIM